MRTKAPSRIDGDGYRRVLLPDHPRADERGYVREHVLLCEIALGRPLPLGAVPHHHNGVRSDNSPGNLVLCPSHEYHMLLHQRQRALAASGHAGWRSCQFCKQYDDMSNLSLPIGPTPRLSPIQPYHKACAAANKRSRRQKQ